MEFKSPTGVFFFFFFWGGGGGGTRGNDVNFSTTKYHRAHFEGTEVNRGHKKAFFKIIIIIIIIIIYLFYYFFFFLGGGEGRGHLFKLICLERTGIFSVRVIPPPPPPPPPPAC